jgi:hypothetical protein
MPGVDALPNTEHVIARDCTWPPAPRLWGPNAWRLGGNHPMSPGALSLTLWLYEYIYPHGYDGIEIAERTAWCRAVILDASLVKYLKPPLTLAVQSSTLYSPKYER